MNNEDKKALYESVFSANLEDASRGILGLKSVKVKISEKERKDFFKQHSVHSLCGCYSCVELGKLFALKTPDIKERIITTSMDDLKPSSKKIIG